jgi:hypothetical protein
MADVIKQNRAVVWVQENGDGTAFLPYADREDGMAMTGKSIPVKGITPVYARDASGAPVVISINETAPGDLPTATIQIYEKAALTILEKMVSKQCPLNFQLRMVACGPLDNPFIWDKIVGLSKGQLTAYSPGDGPSLEFDGSQMTASGSISFRNVLFLVRTGLSGLTVSTETEGVKAIDGIKSEDCNECGTGYPGADKILFLGVDAGSAVQPNVYVSDDGGSTWTVTTTQPFAADEDVDFVQVKLVGPETIRVIIGTGTTDAAAKAKIAYTDVVVGDLATVSAWNDTLLDGTTNADIITAMLWARHDRLYLATDSNEIYIDEHQGEDGTQAASYSGASQIDAFAVSVDGRTVYGAGASNLIVKEQDRSGIFAVKNGPSGGGAFTALAVAADGTLFAGNGQKLYKSIDGAATAGNWEELKDFGTGFTVTNIQCVAQDSNYLRAVVTDASSGEVHESANGGNSWREITPISNSGLADAYFSEVDDNLAYMVGPPEGALAFAQILQPTG